jgi:peptidyl-prolyl cis-trans isomerase C
MRFLHTVSLVALLAFSAPAFADEYVIMKVNGTDVSSSDVQRAWEGLFPQGQAPAIDTVKGDVKERVLRAVMAEKILYSEAVKQGVDKSDKLQRELEDVKKKLVVRTFLDSKTADLITDADLKKEYEAQIASTKDEKEVRARHILLANEKDAKDAKSKLDAGKSFEEVARDYSKDAASAKQGGDLGYFTRDKMVPEFASAAFALKKGEVSGPVKSPFGYHIIKVEDVRKVTVPSFNDSKEAIRAKLQEKKLNEYIGGLVKAADVKVYDATGKETPFNKNLPEAAAKAEPKAAEAKPAAKAEPAKTEPVKTEPAKPAAKEEKAEKAPKAEKPEKAQKPEKPESTKSEAAKSVEKEEKPDSKHTGDAKAEKPSEKPEESAENPAKAEKTN